MTTDEKIKKTINSIKQKTFGRVDDYWLDAFEQGMRVAIEAEALEQKEKTCENCKYCDSELFTPSLVCRKYVNENTLNSSFKSEVSNDFGCNKWKSK